MSVQCAACQERPKGYDRQIPIPDGWRLECPRCVEYKGGNRKIVKSCLRCGVYIVTMGVSGGSAIICPKCVREDPTTKEMVKLRSENGKLQRQVDYAETNQDARVVNLQSEAVKYKEEIHNLERDSVVLKERWAEDVAEAKQGVVQQEEDSLATRIQQKMFDKYGTIPNEAIRREIEAFIKFTAVRANIKSTEAEEVAAEIDEYLEQR